ncbi:hypothetical protein chiPu_0021046 [Chiloscyllium punctatum]|uniref:Uncharacterized protein n=1 Tax=Chiloscyllium punctatum TaxID=137246 RepID=A0A401RMG3_CHIPU|nr:hypothetical protein [Chiloscyllium punctatum]
MSSGRDNGVDVGMNKVGSASSSTLPRLKLNLTAEIHDRSAFRSTEEYTTTLREGSTVYVGGKEVIYHIDLEEAPSLIKTVQWDQPDPVMLMS